MKLPVRVAQALLNGAWRATHWSSEKAAPPSAYPVASGAGGWWNIIHESFAGAWQRNVEVRTDTALTYYAVFRCISLISGDIAKMRLRLVAKDTNGIWTETENAAHSPVLRKPNSYQTRIQFISHWVESKLIHGNTYVLKERDARRVVTRLHILNPMCVTVLQAPDGAVYYQLTADYLSRVPEETITVPASEIIHDRYNSTFNHPLIGISPIRACGLAATQGIRIQEHGTRFFTNGSRPSGVVLVPGDMSLEKATDLKKVWDNREPGTVAILTNGMQYAPQMMSAVDSQMLEQLKWTAEVVASAFGVPAYMIGVGNAPTYNNIEALAGQYYGQCLQVLIENIELLLDEGLELKRGEDGRLLGTEFDLDDLLRMDTATRVKTGREAMMAGASPNEVRKKYHDLGPVDGGETPYLQEQQWPLALLAGRELPTRAPTDPAPMAEPAQEQPGEEDNADGGASERAVINIQERRAAAKRRLRNAVDRNVRRAS